MRIFNSTPRDDNFRMPGEFERHQGCIMIWPVRPGSWIYGGKAAKKVFAKIAAIIAQSEHVYMLADHEHLKEAQEHLKEAHEHLKEAQEQKILRILRRIFQKPDSIKKKCTLCLKSRLHVWAKE